MYYRNKVRGTIYTSCKKENGGLASVTTLNSPQPYLVKDESVEKSSTPFVIPERVLYPVPTPMNKGKHFNRWGTWVEVNFKNPRTLKQMIAERELIIETIPDEEARQVSSDYIAALKVNLAEL